MKNVVLLGSTGSIGTSTVKVAEDLPDQVRLIGLAAGGNVGLLAEQTQAHHPSTISIADETLLPELSKCIPDTVEIYSGDEGLIRLATLPEADIVLIAIVGTAGLKPALAAIRAGKDIAVASKEILVMAGEIVMREAREYGVKVLAVDSEHSAIFQCLDGKPVESIRSIWLTASGGPFRETPPEEFAEITLDQALKHPSWVMGRKITIDSATMFNKGLEMIEARWLFGVEMNCVKVVVHPQSVVHSLVEYVDGSMIAQMSTPDMCLPIQYALTHPERMANQRVQTNLASIGTLQFEEPDSERFPALDLARRAGEVCGTLPAVFNAANEVAVDAFCEGKLSFLGITKLVSDVMDQHQVVTHPDLTQILESDQWARRHAATLI
ncbi:MAG TPA: 1-deoxy-D-xylulose-5-phosphate reductoisomerase [Verrucomicrobiales bacterium]|nr:1-deoxy-D-xylulose-5-phosphate reductoisomerase [Pedosphaera sp.]RZO69423.1 MAG: 1-deoxy-D-xylulose-5-phosphate reductoisomerase [Limisphaerales bacterium]HAO66265.1 1-deoxy-D-xylulose-5-phosphate reductoisomerase [Verrucomicrobiales bacterium]HAW02741.1 1-deoxy-D-xylulose-5-phosphate reductoisomerase [Verrucomicrobiales bacterium]HBP56566.1 1-deoxy-D-xylulose-5-phosphate reductoisomerase [Verrucomicrobiales bacterium]